MIRERERRATSGLLMLAVFLILVAVAVTSIVRAARADDVTVVILSAVVVVVSLLGLAGLFTVTPNEGRVLQLFGAYRGTVEGAGPALGQPLLHQEAGSRCACGTSRAPSSR